MIVLSGNVTAGRVKSVDFPDAWTPSVGRKEAMSG